METQTKTSQTPQALAFFNTAGDTLAYLWSRWQDEKEYEDINDYAKPLQSLADAAGVTIVKMTKRPFGCVIAVEEKQFTVTIKGNGAYEYRRIQ